MFVDSLAMILYLIGALIHKSRQHPGNHLKFAYERS